MSKEGGGDAAAKGVLSGVLSGQPEGTQASAQTEGQASNVHTSSSNPTPHVDGWAGKVGSDGSISTGKIHSSD